MLYCPHYHIHPPPPLRRHFPASTITSCLNQPSSAPDPILRTHNSKSTSLLINHLSHHHDISTSAPKSKNPELPNSTLEIENQDESQNETKQPPIPLDEKLTVLELSLASKRTRQFPGSIYSTSVPPLQSIIQNGDDEEDEEEMILRALEIRRKVTKEVFMEAMRKGKFGITYSTNLVNLIPEFLDHVMIQAAALKNSPELQYSTFNVRVKTVIEESNVIPLIRWLKHNHLTYPKIAKLITMSKGNLDSIRQFIEWLKSIRVKSEFFGAVLLKSGPKILDRGMVELDEVVDYLVSQGVRKDWIGFVISSCPQLLSYSMDELETRVGFYSSMGMNITDFGTMVFDYPGVLGQFTLEEMNQKVDYMKEFGLNTEEVGRLLAFRPQLMCCSIENRWKPIVKYLYYLGISRDGMWRMLTLKPMVFCYDVEANIVPKVRFFKDIGVRDDAIGNMLVKFPRVLTYSLHKKIRPVVIFLMTKAGVTERDIGKVIALGPELLGCSIVRKLEVSVKYFLSLGIRHQQLGEMISDFPMLLRYNVELLRPKYQYLRRTMVRPLQDVIEFPRFFSYNLADRIIPRHKIMVENQVNFKLRYMLACTDEEFEKRVSDKLERRRRFELGILNSPAADFEWVHGSLGGRNVNNFPRRTDHRFSGRRRGLNCNQKKFP